MLEISLWASSPCWHVTHHFGVFTLHIHAANLLFYHNPRIILDSHLLTVDVTELTCSGNHFETFTLWHGALTCWKCPLEAGKLCLQRDEHVQQQYSDKLWHLNHDRFVLKPKVYQKSIHYITPPPTGWTVDTGQVVSMDSWCWLQIVTLPSAASAEIQTHQTRLRVLVFNCPVLVSLCHCSAVGWQERSLVWSLLL